MDEILLLNNNYFEAQKSDKVNLFYVEKIIKKLQKHKIIKVAGLRHGLRTSTVYESISRMGELSNCFYFNSQVFKNSRIASANGILKLVKHASEKKKFEATTILVFESIEDIKNAKDIISELFQEGRYKIILIGTLKHLQGLPTVKVSVPSLHQKFDIRKYPDYMENYMILGSLFSFDYSRVGNDQLQIRNMLTDSCFFQDIIMAYGIKDVFLFQSALSFLSRNLGVYLSLRDITKLLNEGNLGTSVITMTDYINCSLSAGFLHKIKRFDLKKDKKMDSKGSYYFGDLGILACIKKDVFTKKYILFENLLLLELLYSGYDVYTGLNGKFLFSFYIKKPGIKKCIHVSYQTDKKEIRKEINKLTKIKGKSERYLAVESLEELGLRKKDYQQVQLVTYVELLDLLK